MYSKLEFTFHSTFSILILIVDHFIGWTKRLAGFATKTPNYIDGVNLTNNIVIITGANIGIGRETATNLAKCGATVVLGCRDIQKGMQAANDINAILRSQKSLHQNPHGSKGKAVFMRLDLSDLSSVVEFANKVKGEYSRVDILVNNAGLNTGGKLSSGLEQLFQVNYLGHYLLVQCLQKELRSTAGGVVDGTCPSVGRVINLSSVTHHTGQPDFRRSATSDFTMAMQAKYSYYADSKLYMNYLTMEINRRWDYGKPYASLGGALVEDEDADLRSGPGRPIIAISVNPGAVRSDIWRNYPCQRLYNLVMKMLFLEVGQGCASSVFAATTSLDSLRCYQMESSSGEDVGGRLLHRPDIPYVIPYKMSCQCLAQEVLGVYYGCFFGGVSLPCAEETVNHENPSAVAQDLWKYSAQVCVQNLLETGSRPTEVEFLSR